MALNFTIMESTMRTIAPFIRLLVLLASIGLTAAPRSAQAAFPVPGACIDGVLPSGALSRICVPASGWNGDLFIWAHGYVAFNEPLDFYHLTLADGTSLPSVAQGLGYAFATTSYRQNGLAILEGVDDVGELVNAFHATVGSPGHTFLVGASEGGIVTALAIERAPALFSGGLSMCGPIGNFKKQLDYWGDFRVLFDYFFPGLIPGSAISIPPAVIAGWEATYVPAILGALASKPKAALELIKTSKAPIDPADPTTIATTTLNLLWYSVFATNNGIQELGGNPYGNVGRWYFGSSNDLRLNLHVERFVASPVALAATAAHETSGHLTLPLVTLHTTGDEIIPYWHELLYPFKVHTSAAGSLTPIPVVRYGHCNFTPTEVAAAFALLVAQSG
jgi:hypothetical protein